MVVYEVKDPRFKSYKTLISLKNRFKACGRCNVEEPDKCSAEPGSVSGCGAGRWGSNPHSGPQPSFFHFYRRTVLRNGTIFGLVLRLLKTRILKGNVTKFRTHACNDSDGSLKLANERGNVLKNEIARGSYYFLVRSLSCFLFRPTPGWAFNLLCTFPFLNRITVG